jgi:nucleoside-diphosphate-sugar epimerase
MNIAITGASGFIGSNLSSFLTNNGDINLISIVRKVTNKVDEYTFTDFFNGNIKENIDCFIHLASPNYDYSEDNSLQDGIVLLTENILKALPQYQCSNFIFFSSCKVYGESSIKNTNFTESSNLNPVSDYAKAKVDAELLVKKISDEAGLNYLIYRLPFVYGRGMKSNIGKLLKILEIGRAHV